MNLTDAAQVSTYAVASATVVLALATLAYAAQWGLARRVEPDQELVVVGDGAPAGRPPEQVEDAAATRPDASERAAGIGFSLTVLSAVVLAVGVVARGLAAERVPWGNMYEFGCVGILVALVVYLALVRLADIDYLGLLITGFGTVVLGASMSVYVPAGPLVPALQSYWLVIHVLAAMIAGAAFLVGAAASVLFLLTSRAETRAAASGVRGPRRGLLARMPAPAALDRLAYRVHAFAFPLWTFGVLIAGPIWAHFAWGRYWGWDPKEVWAFVTWVVYAGYLHARATAGWRGRAAAWLAIAGFVTFLINYVGVNLFVDGLHSYAK